MSQMSYRGQKIFAQLFCSFFIVAGIIALIACVWVTAKSIRAEHWPVTDGIVQTAKMTSGRDNQGHTTHSADVTYSYKVAGTSYTGDKVASGEISSSAAYAQGILHRYPVGKTVTVHYSPDNPSDAVLETGIHGATWICLGVGTVFVLVGILSLKLIRAATRLEMPAAPQAQ